MSLSARLIALGGLGGTPLVLATLGLAPLGAANPPANHADALGGWASAGPARSASFTPLGRSRRQRRNDLLFIRP